MTAEILHRLRTLSEKIAEELVFAEPGKDAGLQAAHALLLEIEQLLPADEATASLTTAVKLARRWMDEIVGATRGYDEAAAKQFGTWTIWWWEAVCSIEQGSALPPWPAEWESSPSAENAHECLQTRGQDARAPRRFTDAPEAPLLLNLPQDRELLWDFVTEAQEHLHNIEQGVLVLEHHPADADTLNSIFRAFHTFKGCSGYLNLKPILSLAHELESLLHLARKGELAITPDIIDIILEGADALKKLTNEISGCLAGTKSGCAVVPTLPLLAKIRSALGSAPVGEEVRSPVEHPNRQSGARCEGTPSAADGSPSDCNADPSGLRQGGGAEDPNVSLQDNRPATLPLPFGRGEGRGEGSFSGEPFLGRSPLSEHDGRTGLLTLSPTNSKPQAPANTVKVDTQKLDSLMDLVGEMVIAQSLVVQSDDLATVKSEQLTRDLSNFCRITKDLQRIAMSVRMVPIRPAFQKMNRLVRDLTARLDKQVELVITGEETELDRTIVEEISDPLVHMIRNAIDHGIERPEMRLERGKPARGRIWLSAYHQGGSIVIEVKDDGNGLDRERILAKAIQRGLVKSGEPLSDNEVFSLIFAAGLSTAELVSDLSGRGVGMDVVQRNIEKLRGKIEIASTSGQGSTFKIFLPLTMAIIDGLVVAIGEQRYIIPTLSVSESFRPSATMVHTIQGRGEMIQVRGRLRPLLRLYQELGITPTSSHLADGLVVVVESGGAARCIFVDRLIGKQEVVIKTLGETIRQSRFVAGAAILGDGCVSLILDPQALVHPDASPLEAAA